MTGGCCGGNLPTLQELMAAGRVVGCAPRQPAGGWWGCAHCGAVIEGWETARHGCFSVGDQLALEGTDPGHPFLYADPLDGA